MERYRKEEPMERYRKEEPYRQLSKKQKEHSRLLQEQIDKSKFAGRREIRLTLLKGQVSLDLSENPCQA
jgi:hypothetical protein